MTAQNQDGRIGGGYKQLQHFHHAFDPAGGRGQRAGVNLQTILHSPECSAILEIHSPAISPPLLPPSVSLFPPPLTQVGCVSYHGKIMQAAAAARKADNYLQYLSLR